MNGPLKWHGGKSYLADWITSLMPASGWIFYREPYFGGGSVLLRMSGEGVGESVNDINGELWNFWRVMREPEFFRQFQRMCESTPFSQRDFADCKAMKHVSEAGIVGSAWNFFVRCRQSRQGLMKDFATPTRRTRRGMNENVSAWLSAVEGLPEVHRRLKRVEVCNMDALEFIKRYDSPKSLFYCDPPYLHSTRVTKADYLYEMTDDDHRRLLQHLDCIEGMFLLSGYDSHMYESFARASGWKCHRRRIDNKASGKRTKEQKTECVWTNF